MNVPVVEYGRTPDQIVNFYKEAIRRIETLPGVDSVALGTTVPWRDSDRFGPGFQYTADGLSLIHIFSQRHCSKRLYTDGR